MALISMYQAKHVHASLVAAQVRHKHLCCMPKKRCMLITASVLLCSVAFLTIAIFIDAAAIGVEKLTTCHFLHCRTAHLARWMSGSVCRTVCSHRVSQECSAGHSMWVLPLCRPEVSYSTRLGRYDKATLFDIPKSSLLTCRKVLLSVVLSDYVISFGGFQQYSSGTCIQACCWIKHNWVTTPRLGHVYVCQQYCVPCCSCHWSYTFFHVVCYISDKENSNDMNTDKDVNINHNNNKIKDIDHSTTTKQQQQQQWGYNNELS